MSISRGERRKSKRELIVVLKPSAAVAEVAPDTSGLEPILVRYKARIQRISHAAEKAIAASGAPQTELLARLARYQQVVADDKNLEELRAELVNHPLVETAYIKPAGQPPSVSALRSVGTTMMRSAVGASSTPDFTSHQGYLGPAPVGVDALYAWQIRGGTGAGVNIIDCEWSWNFAHEDLATHCGGLVIGTSDGEDDDHGTAVIGVVIGNANGFGITGIAPDATLSTAAFGDSSDTATSAVILQAADKLSAGDILLLEIHRPGPNSRDGQQTQFGFIPIEWWPDDFHAISYATAKGVLVVEAGGNGSQNLDDPVYSTPLPGFPSEWKNPFAPNGPDSGAIIVGAGNPPSGTHGRTQDTIGWNDVYVDRARCAFSNFGGRIDCQGWGWEVTTLGIGDLQPGLAYGVQPSDHNRLYTDTFDGTSSASPIVTGVLACAQGAIRAAGRPLLTPGAARQLLRSTGSPQQSAPDRPATQRIGSRPDLQAILHTVTSAPSPVAPAAQALLAPLREPGRRLRGVAWLAWFALVAAAILTVGMSWLGSPDSIITKSPLVIWLCDLFLISLFVLAIGAAFKNTWTGVAVDWRGRLSLARAQMIIWTILFVATLLVVFVWNVAHGGKVDLVIPPTVWLLMGIAGVSAVGTPLILSQKPGTVPSGAPLAPTGMFSQGVVVARPVGSRPAWSDLILGDEVGNATSIDIGKVQQLLLTAVAVIVYAIAVAYKLAVVVGAAAVVDQLPPMSDGFVSLLAASHATYLAYKAVPHT